MKLSIADKQLISKFYGFHKLPNECLCHRINKCTMYEGPLSLTRHTNGVLELTFKCINCEATLHTTYDSFVADITNGN